ncbi:G-protein coupled receptor 126 [Trichoplax sp. H2]|nr:G-protein coupled receptor 126 [Trichoplax sp. H2]|eukprot:RDD44479.1 G-protein coupled receptor 126 [Trichoplax sp. H2]
MKFLLLLAILYLDIVAADKAPEKNIASGNSIFKLTIKNRPYTSIYKYTSKEPYLSLVAEIKYGMRTMFFGAVGNYYVPRLGKVRPYDYCVPSSIAPTAANNTTPIILPTDCRICDVLNASYFSLFGCRCGHYSQTIVQIKAILFFNYSLNADFRREKIKQIWDIAMTHGFIGNLMLVPEQCELQLKLTVQFKSTLPSMIKNITLSNSTNYEAIFRRAIRTTSEIGNGLSLIGAIMTIMTLRYFRKLRAKRVNLLICILSVTVAACNALNFAVQRAANYPTLCKIVSISMHFFLLSKTIWTTILALHLYFKLIKVFSAINYVTTTRLIKFTILLGFGIPALAVGTAAVLDGDNIYERNANGLKSSISHHRIRTKITMSQVRSLMAFVTALGLAWIFVLLTYIEGPTVLRHCFEAMFVTFTSLQGFFLYYLYCISKKEIRICYLELFDYKPNSQTPTITGTSTKRTGTYVVRNSVLTSRPM